jgi:hypothetical protein
LKRANCAQAVIVGNRLTCPIADAHYPAWVLLLHAPRVGADFPPIELEVIARSIRRQPDTERGAGNRNSVVTLWRVPDASAAEFVKRLFELLKAGAPPAVALARTKREMAQHRRYSAPLHWAGFVLYGAQ